MPRVDDAGASAIVTTADRLAKAQMWVHFCSGIEKPDTNQHGRMFRITLVVEQVAGEGQGFDIVIHLSYHGPIALGEGLTVCAPVAADIRQAIWGSRIRPPVARVAQVVMLVATGCS